MYSHTPAAAGFDLDALLLFSVVAASTSVASSLAASFHTNIHGIHNLLEYSGTPTVASSVLIAAASKIILIIIR